MKTEDLIRAMAADTTRQAGTERVVALGLPLALIAAASLLWLALGFRGDLAQTMEKPLQALRLMLALALAWAGLGMVLGLARPTGAARRSVALLAGVAVVAVLLWLQIWYTTPGDSVVSALLGNTLAVCLIAIPTLSILPALCLFAAVRAGATTRPGLAGAGIGLAAGGFAAAIYSLHCTEDNPLFYVTWYGLGIAAVTLGCSLAGQRLLRW
jgi:hypothetical protein